MFRWSIEALLIEYFRNVSVQFKLGAIQYMQTIGFCGFVFREENDEPNVIDPWGQQQPEVGYEPTNQSPVASEASLGGLLPDQAALLVAAAQLQFPELYDGASKNATQLIYFFDSRCDGVNSTVCNGLDAIYREYLDYSACEAAG
eukprot:scaffold304404_cov34-Prasinocladus_malaysianus.AAC.1